MNVATEPDRSVGLRERKKRATWAALHRAALTLVRDHGIDQVTIDDIAAAADVSPRTFFNYFRTKEDAIIGISPEHVDQLATDLRGRPEHETAVEAIQAVLTADCDRVLRSQDLWELRVTVASQYPQLFQSAWAASAKLEGALTAALGERMGLDPRIDTLPGILAGMAVAIRRNTVRVWVLGSFQQSYRAILTSTFTALTELDLASLNEPSRADP